MKAFKDTTWGTSADPKHIKFVETLCEFRAGTFDERLREASVVTGLGQEAIDDPMVQELLYNYLSFYLYNSKFQLLLNYQLLQWRISKLFLNSIDATESDELTKSINLMDKMTDLSWKLEQKISGLYSEVYGDEKIIDIAREQVKMLTPEQRMKSKQKQAI